MSAPEPGTAAVPASRETRCPVCGGPNGCGGAAGGIGAVPAAGDAAALAASFKQSGASLACICGSDKRYAEEAVTAAKALKAAGATRIYMAGKPGDLEPALRDAGVAEFIHIGVDVLASLELAHAELGLG